MDGDKVMIIDDDKKKNEIVKAMVDVECYPYTDEIEADMERYTKIPLTKISAMGATFASLPTSFNTIEQTVSQAVDSGIAGGEGLYRVVFKDGVTGTLAQAKDGDGYLGAIMNKGVKGQARLIKADFDPVKVTTSIPYNPATLFMATALISIDQKLNVVMETQQEILNFLVQDKEAKLRGDLGVLSDIINNYKYNWDNENFISSKLDLVQNIKRDAKHNIIFYRKQTESNLKKKQLIHVSQDIQNKLGKVQNQFKYYRLAVYLYSFSSFLEVMLLGNFKSEYLNSVIDDLEEHSYQYRLFYTKCYDQIQKYAKSSIDSQLMDGIANLNKFASDKISKIPVVGKSPVDEFLIETGNRLEKFGSGKIENAMDQFKDNKDSNILIFMENINTINRLYNQPSEFIFDREYMYISNG